jgi:hypothetical protein
MTEKPVKRYTIDGKPMTPDDLRRLHDYLIDIEAIELSRKKCASWSKTNGPSSSTSFHRDDDIPRHFISHFSLVRWLPIVANQPSAFIATAATQRQEEIIAAIANRQIHVVISLS